MWDSGRSEEPLSPVPVGLSPYLRLQGDNLYAVAGILLSSCHHEPASAREGPAVPFSKQIRWVCHHCLHHQDSAPQARLSLAQHGAAGAVLGSAGNMSESRQGRHRGRDPAPSSCHHERASARQGTCCSVQQTNPLGLPPLPASPGFSAAGAAQFSPARSRRRSAGYRGKYVRVPAGTAP
jgi:hypothetical protein